MNRIIIQNKKYFVWLCRIFERRSLRIILSYEIAFAEKKNRKIMNNKFGNVLSWC